MISFVARARITWKKVDGSSVFHAKLLGPQKATNRHIQVSNCCIQGKSIVSALHHFSRSPFGITIRSRPSNNSWATIASKAAGMAPSRINEVSSSRMPVRMGCP